MFRVFNLFLFREITLFCFLAESLIKELFIELDRFTSVGTILGFGEP